MDFRHGLGEEIGFVGDSGVVVVVLVVVVVGGVVVGVEVVVVVVIGVVEGLFWRAHVRLLQRL